MTRSIRVEVLKKLARIDDVPLGWGLSTVGKVCSIENNLRKPISREERAVMHGEYPYYGPTGLLDYINEFRVEGRRALIGEDGDHFLKFAAAPMTLLVEGKYNVNNHAHIIASTSKCLAEWFYLFFMHRDITHMLNRQGVGRYKLNKQTLARLPIILPPIEEQSCIFATLSTWDRAIEKTEALIEAKERRKKGLLQRLLTGKVRLGEFVQSDIKRSTKSYDLPKDWGYPTIGDVAQQISRKNTDGTSLPVLSCTKHSGLVDSMAYFGKQVYSKDLSTYKIAPRGAFVYATNHIEEGSIGVQNLYDEAVISPMYTVFKTTNSVHDGFLFKLLKTEWYRHIFEVRTSSSVNRRGSLRWNEFAKINIPLPCMEEQEKLSEVLDMAVSEIQQLQGKLDALKEQKKGLMQQLLTGKVRVKIGETA
ncbi:MAG: restriction endonuclease subunit S [Pseudodesulfovibrio sp.]|nr:restriction endonuclease subunit S [Pseudodesulfovibrio sp.]